MAVLAAAGVEVVAVVVMTVAVALLLLANVQVDDDYDDDGQVVDSATLIPTRFPSRDCCSLSSPGVPCVAMDDLASVAQSRVSHHPHFPPLHSSWPSNSAHCLDFARSGSPAEVRR